MNTIKKELSNKKFLLDFKKVNTILELNITTSINNANYYSNKKICILISKQNKTVKKDLF